ncbi:MAG: NADH-quinone oxidoreductase subunit K [Brevinematales bacterium]
MIIDLNFIIFASIILLMVTGLYCLLVTKNLLRILIALEVMTKSVTLFLISSGYFSGNAVLTQALVITLIIIEVVVIVVACGIVIGVCVHNKNLDIKNMRKLKG